ncbi:unnamed protein product [Rodentolepis nana]|uniref:TLC domain-containing protein n=1 Tax=Rodentolepis nana TaxID=102285 RepID=A0A0R3TC13_RODNA|nr:unnamed protein product [Rodentolepis nana]
MLESGKFLVALRSKYPEHSNILEYVANLFFGVFVVSWFYLRIYLFPTKVIYGSTWGVYLTHLDREAYFFLFFNAMLVALYVLHIYWSYFIVVMLVKIATGRMPKIEDEREFESDSSLSPVKANGVHSSSSKAPATNGIHKHKKLQ